MHFPAISRGVFVTFTKMFPFCNRFDSISRHGLRKISSPRPREAYKMPNTFPHTSPPFPNFNLSGTFVGWGHDPTEQVRKLSGKNRRKTVGFRKKPKAQSHKCVGGAVAKRSVTNPMIAGGNHTIIYMTPPYDGLLYSMDAAWDYLRALLPPKPVVRFGLPCRRFRGDSHVPALTMNTQITKEEWQCNARS